jgi:FkbH-like protein
MKAVVAPFDELHLPRITQLFGKTNQFNLTTRRYGASELRAFMSDVDCVTLYLRLIDRFADHGLVSVAIGTISGQTLEVDSLLMSCRVIGRTVEAHMLAHLCRAAGRAGCTRLRGTYAPTRRNQVVSDLYERFGFTLVERGDGGTTSWEYELSGQDPIISEFIGES